MGLVVRQGFLMAAKDTKVFFKDRFAVAFAFLFPLMFVLGFSLAFGNMGPEDKQLQLTVATREEAGVSQQIIGALTESPEIGVQVLPYDEALRAVEDQQIEGFLAFPSDFTASLMSGNPTTIEVVGSADAPDTQAALEGLARLLAGRISNIQTAFRAIFELQTMETGGIPSIDLGALSEGEDPISFQPEQVGDIEPVSASNFTLPGYLTMFVFFAAAMSAEAIARERQTQTLERLMSNGVRRESVIFGKYLGAAYKGLMQLAVLWVVGILGFGIDLGAAPVAVILISVLMVLASAGFAVMLASMVRTVRSADSAGVLASLTLAPVGGCWWPLFIAPVWMQNLAKLTPHGWANTGFNKVMLFGAGSGDVVLEMVALVIFAIAFVMVALWRFRLSLAR